MQGYRSKDTDDSRAGSNPANASLIKRFNQHSTMVLKSCDKKSTTTASGTNAAASAEPSVERLRKDVTINGGIHVSAVASAQNSTVAVSSNAADATSNGGTTDKHVRRYH